ncbi:hypothetical protein KVF89_22520 [Nocardioides carbamazepini]|uniref:hypothetical protein n=1 Tax=Nocardioides carbamazepini TaxID=2854259 RepID=UPI00214A3AEC|nr:hypothetical protein [Nocardioides carbamazepini]MCR1785332.1 hypothetical protein [Nocardioides carbamazepini]
MAELDEVEQLRRWKAEATTLFDGMQDLGRALGIPLGVLITGPKAVEAAGALRARAEAAESALAAVRALADLWDQKADENERHREYTDHKGDRRTLKRLARHQRMFAHALRAVLPAPTSPERSEP